MPCRGRFSSEIWNRNTLKVVGLSVDCSSLTHDTARSSSFSARESPYWKSKLPFHSLSLLKSWKFSRDDKRC